MHAGTGTDQNFIIGYRDFLRKVQTINTNQSFIIRCRYFSCRYLFVSLWHCSHMSLPYILPMSDDGLMFFCFSFCRALGLLLCLKSKKHNMDVSAGNGQFWQQNIIQDRKSFITQSKLMIFWQNKKFLKAYDLLLLSPGKQIELNFGHGLRLCWPSFCPNGS